MAQGPNLAANVSSLVGKVKLRLAHMPEKAFNVLVVGMPGAGKSSFINSMIMAVTGTWWEVAHYGEFETGRITTCLERYVMFDDNCKEAYEKHPIPGYKKNVVFWDCAGFKDANEEAYSKIVSLTLDGRVPPGTEVLDWTPNHTPEQLEREFGRVGNNVTFDRIVFIISANREVPINLARAIKSGARQGHDVPIFVVMTKVDKYKEDPDVLKKREDEAQAEFKLTKNQVRFKSTSLYCMEITGCSDPNDHRVMEPNAKIDSNLLNIWLSLTDPNIKAKRAAPATPAPVEPTNILARPAPPRPWPWNQCVLS